MSCLDYFYRLLSLKEYSVHELQKKGKEKGFDLDEILSAIEHLQNQGYQSDTKVIVSAISSAKGKYARPVIRRKCLAKGITSELFDQVWDAEVVENEDDELDLLSQLKAKIMRKYKIESWQNIDHKTKAKVISYLQYRGFNPFEIIKKWTE